MKKKQGIFVKLMMLVFGVVVAVLLVVSVFIRGYIEQREMEVVKQRIQSTAQIVASNDIVKQTIATQQHNNEVVAYTDYVTQTTQVDFIVVMDKQFIRYSHPTHDIIGGVFSNVDDAASTIETGAHFSYQDGTLGAGVRYFDVIKDNDGNIIGVVCVGYRRVTVDKQINQAQQRIFGALVYGLLIAGVLAYIFSIWLKHIMLGLEPEELSRLLVESVAVSNHISEGIIALDLQHNVLFFNTSAKTMLLHLQPNGVLKKGHPIDKTLELLLFDKAFENKEIQHNQRVIVDKTELIVGRSPIYIKGKFSGVVVTFQDQTELSQLVTELSSTEQYNDVLRAANHHHMNQMYVLSGLLELKQYDKVEKFIDYLKRDYHESIGYISSAIKIPAIVGFLLGKQQELRRKNITMHIDSDSVVEEIDDDAFIHDLTLILGVFIDNAMEASQPQQQIELYIQTNIADNKTICIVEDYGEGMDDEQQRHIFKRGYSTKGDNRGYGLDAVQTIVNDRNGVIDVASQKGQGTCITIEMAIFKESEITQ